jgi:hypothetical protein
MGILGVYLIRNHSKLLPTVNMEDHGMILALRPCWPSTIFETSKLNYLKLVSFAKEQ